MTLIVVCARTVNIPEYRKQLLKNCWQTSEVGLSLTLRSDVLEP